MMKSAYLLLQFVQYSLLFTVIVWLTIVSALSAHWGPVIWVITDTHGLHTVDLVILAAGTILLAVVSIRYLRKVRRDLGTMDVERSVDRKAEQTVARTRNSGDWV